MKKTSKAPAVSRRRIRKSHAEKPSPKPLYSLYKVRTLKQRAAFLEYAAPDAFWRAPVRVLAICYNGIGPAQWSSSFRRLVTRFLAPFEVSALIHDFEYTCSPRTFRSFSAANWRFLRNSVFEAADRGRFRMVLEGALLALLCQCFGWQAFKAVEK